MRFDYADGRMPYSMTKGGSTYYLTYDQVGSLRAVCDAAGAIVKRIDYDTFGNILSDSAPAFAVPFGFAGGLHDRDVGLVRFGMRDYDPETGRWTAKDPIGFAGGDVDLYGYGISDPVNFADALGLKPCPETSGGSNPLDWWAKESALPGPFGQPVSEWGSNGPTDWGDPMSYTDQAGGGWRIAEDLAVGTAVLATSVAILAGTGIIPNWEIGWKGGEITLTRPGAPTPDWRFNPQQFHYHRRPGIGNHRPWEGGW